MAVIRKPRAREKVGEAQRTFHLALHVKSDNAKAKRQQLIAKLGIARCDAIEGEFDAAVKAAKHVLSKADPKDVELQAKGYNTLGTVYRRAGKKENAVQAFSRVDSHYSTDRQSHAEALKNLEDLWNAAGNPDEAARAREILDTRYKNSRWAQ